MLTREIEIELLSIMGVTGLLPLLRPLTTESHVKGLRNKTVGIDAYCWLHKVRSTKLFVSCCWLGCRCRTLTFSLARMSFQHHCKVVRFLLLLVLIYLVFISNEIIFFSLLFTVGCALLCNGTLPGDTYR